MDAYADEYPNRAFGILQEDVQNGIDAYAENTAENRMHIEFDYDADKRTLRYRDYDTLGMGHCSLCIWGIIEREAGRVPCTERECRWGCYHNIAYSGKGGTLLGSRGLGKSVRIASGRKTTVKTKLPDGRAHASIWEQVGGDWKWRPAPEIAWDSETAGTKAGTEITTHDVLDEVHSAFLDVDAILRELQSKWFKPIEKGLTIKVLLRRGGQIAARRKVSKLKWPSLDSSLGRDKAAFSKRKEVIKLHGRRLGELRNIELRIAARPIKESEPHYGIAIVKNGKQVIKRFSSFPEEIPESIRKRVFGWVEAICTDEEPFLNDAENATHTGYRWTHSTYKAVRRALRSLIREFISPFVREKGKKVSEKEQKDAEDLLRVFNKALANVEALQIFGVTSEGGTRTKVLRDHPYISRIELDRSSYSREETARIRIVTMNPTSEHHEVMVRGEAFDPTPSVIEDTRDLHILPPGDSEHPGRDESSWELYLDPSYVPGIYGIKATLTDQKDMPLRTEEGELITARKLLYLEREPPKRKFHRRGGRRPGDRGTGPGQSEKQASGLLANLQYFKRPEKPELEVLVDIGQAAAALNLAGRRFGYAREVTSTKSGAWPVGAQVLAEELERRKVRQETVEGEIEFWPVDQVQAKFEEIAEARKQLVHEFIREIS